MSYDHREFIGFYEETKNKLLTYYMYRLNFDQALAEDLLMDVVLKAYEKFETYNPNKGSFKNWIFAIANNHLKNYWRNHSGKETESLESLGEKGFQVVATQDTRQNASDTIIKEGTQYVLNLLKPEEKQVIILRYVNDFTYTEIADMLDKQEGAIRTQLSRALERFKSIYLKLHPQANV